MVRHPVRWLLVILLLGAFVRVVLAPHPGFMEFGGDMQFNRLWMKSAVAFGAVESFAKQLDGNMLPNHGPVEIAAYAAVGHAYRLLVSPTMEDVWVPIRIALKTPAMLADLALCVALYGVVARLRGKRAALLASLVYALHPAVLHNSALWGQTDAIYTLFVVVAFSALGRKKHLLAGAAMALACLTKPQAAIFLPLFAFAIPWKPRQALDVFNAGVGVTLLALLPFLLHGLLDVMVQNVYLSTFGQGGRLSWNAFNFWWAVLGGDAGRDAAGLFLGIVSFKQAGYALFGLTYAATLWTLRKALRGHGRARLSALFAAAGLIAAAFFLFFPGVHERYMYPAMAFMLPMAFSGARGRTVYMGVSACFFFNVLSLLHVGDADLWMLRQLPNLPAAVATCQMILLVPHVRWVLSHRGASSEREPLLLRVRGKTLATVAQLAPAWAMEPEGDPA